MLRRAAKQDKPYSLKLKKFTNEARDEAAKLANIYNAFCKP